MKKFLTFVMIVGHLLSIMSFYMISNIKYSSIIVQIVLFIFGFLGITAGYHRLWSHKSYEANEFLQIFLMIFGTTATQGNAITWVKEHRTHHRNEEKHGDPHNINRGFFHAHIGWLLFDYDKKELSEIQKTDISDLLKNKVLLFQRKHYSLLWWLFSIFIPLILSMIWNDIYNMFWLNIIRMCFIMHFTFFVNSLAHIIGNKPYDNTLKASDNLLVSILTFGEGWHNYHHTFPKDYRASPGNVYNPTTWFIYLTKVFGLSKNLTINSGKIQKTNKFDEKQYTQLI